MACEVIRKLLKARIRSALDEAIARKGVDHPGMRGSAIENSLRELVRELLPASARAGSGKIVDMNGTQSKQIDIAVFSSFILPAIFLDRNAGDLLIPLEACISTIEVKSQLNAGELGAAMENAKSVRNLYHVYDGPRQATPLHSRHSSALFALGSDLQGPADDELDRYVKRDAEAFEAPVLPMFCVVGRGVWVFVRGNPPRWNFTPANDEHDEVVDFFSVLANGISDWMGRAPDVRIGDYTIAQRPYTRFFRDRPAERCDENGSPLT